ncbi:hypothetical protein [Ferruginibacter sp.]
MEIVFTKPQANTGSSRDADLAFTKPVKKFAVDQDEKLLYNIFITVALQQVSAFAIAAIVFAKARSKLNEQYFYPMQFIRLICRRRKSNKVGVL